MNDHIEAEYRRSKTLILKSIWRLILALIPAGLLLLALWYLGIERDLQMGFALATTGMLFMLLSEARDNARSLRAIQKHLGIDDKDEQ